MLSVNRLSTYLYNVRGAVICGPSSAFLYDLCVKVDYAVGGGLYDYQNVYTLWGWYQLKWSPYVGKYIQIL